MSFLSKFKSYDKAMEPGVKLPKLKIDSRFYREVGIKKDVSNFQFLTKICNKGLLDKKLNKKTN